MDVPQHQMPQPDNPVPPPPQAPPHHDAIAAGIPRDYHGRLVALCERAVGEMNRVRSLTSAAGVFTIIVCGLGGLGTMLASPAMFLSGLAGGGQGPSAGDILAGVGLALLNLMFLGLAIYAIIVLANLGKLYYTSYERTTDLLRETDLPLMIVNDPFWQQITDKLNAATIFKFTGKSTYKRIEDHLSYSAFHLDSLIAIADGRFDQSIWQLRNAETAFRNQRIFQQKTWVYWTGGCLTLILNQYLFFVPVLIVIWGSRFVSSRGRLVAICEYVLREDPNALPPVYAMRTMQTGVPPLHR